MLDIIGIILFPLIMGVLLYIVISLVNMLSNGLDIIFRGGKRLTPEMKNRMLENSLKSQQIEKENKILDNSVIERRIISEKQLSYDERYKCSQLTPWIAFITLVCMLFGIGLGVYSWMTATPINLWVFVLFLPMILFNIISEAKDSWKYSLIAKELTSSTLFIMSDFPLKNNLIEYLNCFILVSNNLRYVSNSREYINITINDFNKFNNKLFELINSKNMNNQLPLTYQNMVELIQLNGGSIDMVEVDKKTRWLSCNLSKSEINQDIKNFIDGSENYNFLTVKLIYEPGYFYSNSKSIFYIYNITKVINGLFALILICLIGYILLSWILSFSATTIIIILLLVIIILLLILICGGKK
ncbi:hypothetical protein [Legionella sainthelensi]|uniref:hypothetical protein n=1 Tax=Legionella sainthelensi TaxID=28087 RepID=UPI000E201D94|nr:hypothetical protein [Legionella sainthelensi]